MAKTTTPKVFSIIRDGQSLNQGLTNFARTAAAFRNAAHVLAVSCLVHANEHGQIAPLNRFVSMLLPNEVTALRNYVRRFQETRDANHDLVKTDLAFLKFVMVKGEGQFRIDTDTPVENRGEKSAFVKHAEKNLINPDGKTYKPFLEQDNVKDISILGDDKVLSGIRKLLKNAKGENEGVVSRVTEKYLMLLTKTAAEAERINAANN